MWIFTDRGFFSIVRDYTADGCLLVRARIAGDIENIWPKCKVIKTPDHDYMYRTTLPAKEVAEAIADLLAGVQYTAYKPSIRDKKRREDYYLRVWGIMNGLQHDAEYGNDHV